MLTIAEHFFKRPKAFMIGHGILSASPPISKLINDLYVYAPNN